ncbi:MAG: hypothetical protein HC887_04690 [Desulfobacteraceae bacterium]|nr:hypothetical protein [Desulfobacteraceae bacterium]
MSLGDLVWNDNGLGGGVANNGIKDDTEPGIAGVEVWLLDSSGVPIPDVAGNPIKTITGSNGKYLFTGLNPGDYKVRIAASNFNGTGVLVAYRSTTDQAGFDTPNNDKNENQDENGIDPVAPNTPATSGITSGTVTLALGTEPPNNAPPLTTSTTDSDNDANSNLTIDFGFYAPVSIGNQVWFDANGDGKKDATEPPIAGVTVKLYKSDGTLATDLNGNPAIQITDAQGYNFTNLLPGTYYVEIPASNWQTGGVFGTGGLYPGAYGSPGSGGDNQVNNDDNGNNDGAAAIASGVRSGNISLNSGSEPKSEDAQETTPDNNSDLTIDFGFYTPVSIGNLVWNDGNNNGIADVYENGIDGVRVELYREGQTPGINPVAAMDTSGGGFYKFSGLEPGRYFVYIPNPPPDYLASSSAIVTDTNDNGEDNDDNGIQSVAGAPTRSPIITLTSRGEPDTVVDGDDVTGDMTVDFGFHTMVTIGNFVWSDGNVNGIQDAGELGIPNVTVSLFDKDGNPVTDVYGKPVNPITTDADGYYQFADLAPGQYYVQFDKPAGYTPSPAHQGSDESKDSDADPTTGKTPIITLTSTGDHTIWDAGFWSPVSLGDYVWYDKNGNGIQDADEKGISGVTVKLFATSDDGVTLTPATDVNGNSVADVTTDASGHYLFADLPGGDYVVEIIPPSGYALTKGGTDPDNDVNTDSNGYISSSRVLSHPITLFLGREPSDDGDSDISSNLTVDFGFISR